MERKLGKKPHTPDGRDLMLAAYIDKAVLPTPPETFTSAEVVQDGEWGMLLNDQLGDCVPAGISHAQLVLGRLGEHHPEFGEHSVLAAYEEWGGYVPGDPSTDEGTDMRVAAKQWQRKGILDNHSQYHRSGAYLWLEPGNLEELFLASFIFKNGIIGYQLPRSAMEEFDAAEAERRRPIWDYDASSPIEGGHCVPGFGRVAELFDSVSWGSRVGVSGAFIENYMDSGFTVVSSSMLGADGETPEGLDHEKLIADLKQLEVVFA